MSAALPDRPTLPELLDKLDALGHPDQIALFLSDYGIVATPCRAQECAVAQYLENELVRAVAVGADEALLFEPSERPDQRFKLPENVRQFVAAFDELDYPDLVDWARMGPAAKATINNWATDK